jgi:hypothetical protein
VSTKKTKLVTTHVSLHDFVAWLATAEAGERFTYCVGDLRAARLNNPALDALATAVYLESNVPAIEDTNPAGSGRLHLTQRRLEDGRFEYLATRASEAVPPRPRFISRKQYGRAMA